MPLKLPCAHMCPSQGSVAIKSIAAHRPGPQAIQADGHPAYVGVRGLRVCKQDKVLLSGGWKCTWHAAHACVLQFASASHASTHLPSWRLVFGALYSLLKATQPHSTHHFLPHRRCGRHCAPVGHL